MACGGAVWLAYGQLQPRGDAESLLFRQEYHRADNGNVLAAKVCYRAESIQPAFVKKTHEEGFYNIVSVVAKGYKIAAALLSGIVQRTAP